MQGVLSGMQERFEYRKKELKDGEAVVLTKLLDTGIATKVGPAVCTVKKDTDPARAPIDYGRDDVCRLPWARRVEKNGILYITRARLDFFTKKRRITVYRFVILKDGSLGKRQIDPKHDRINGKPYKRWVL